MERYPIGTTVDLQGIYRQNTFDGDYIVWLCIQCELTDIATAARLKEGIRAHCPKCGTGYESFRSYTGTDDGCVRWRVVKQQGGRLTMLMDSI